MIDEFLATHPLPWKMDELNVYASIVDAKNVLIENTLRPPFAEFVVELVNGMSGTLDAIARKNAMLNEAAAKIEELRAERDSAIENFDELRAELTSAEEDAAELHDLVAVQRELIDRLQARVKRLEARS